MAENLTQNQIITIAGRKKMLRARAGEIQLPKIVGFVFGDGGVDADGNVIAPLEAESELKNELLRKKYDTYTMLSDTKCKYECELKESELPGAAISEIGLYDADGDIVTINCMKQRREVIKMLELYIKLVKAGKRTIDSIPEKFRDDVRAAIEAAEDAAE